MGKDYSDYPACRHKATFADQLSAERHAAAWKNKRGKPTQRAYPCNLCNGWHLTTIVDKFK